MKKIGNTNIAILIGQENCEACEKMKGIFKKMDIPFLYQDIKDLDQEMKRWIVDTRKANGVKSAGVPFWWHNGTLYSGVDEKKAIEVIIDCR